MKKIKKIEVEIKDMKQNGNYELSDDFKDRIISTVKSMKSYDYLICILCHMPIVNSNIEFLYEIHNLLKVQPWFKPKKSIILKGVYSICNYKIILELYKGGASLSLNLLDLIKFRAEDNIYHKSVKGNYTLLHFHIINTLDSKLLEEYKRKTVISEIDGTKLLDTYAALIG